MSEFLVSARKYRPQTFDQVVGQSSVTSTLQNAIKSNQLAQSFLELVLDFYGYLRCQLPAV